MLAVVVVVIVVAVVEVHVRTCTCYRGYSFLFEKHNKQGPGYWAVLRVEGLLAAAHACGELQGLASAASPPCYPRRYAKTCILMSHFPVSRNRKQIPRWKGGAWLF